MSSDRKKIPDEGTTAPDARPDPRPEARPEVRQSSGLFQAGPSSTMFDEHASEDAVARAVSDQVLALAETDPLAAQAADVGPALPRHVDIGPSGTDATHLNLESATDDTRPTPMVNRHELEAQLARQGAAAEDPIDLGQGTVAGRLGPESQPPTPRVKPVPIEPFETTSPGALGGAPDSGAPPTGVGRLVEAYARPKMAQTLTFVPELGRPEIGAPRRQRGEPKQESLLDRIGQPVKARTSRSPKEQKSAGLWAFITSSPTHAAAGVFVFLALLLLGAVVVVKLRPPAAPAIMSRPLGAPSSVK